jgi:hypothetical protein
VKVSRNNKCDVIANLRYLRCFAVICGVLRQIAVNSGELATTASAPQKMFVTSHTAMMTATVTATKETATKTAKVTSGDGSNGSGDGSGDSDGDGDGDGNNKNNQTTINYMRQQ